MFLLKIRKSLTLWKMSKRLSLEESGPIYDHNCVCSDNPGRSNWNTVKKSSKIEQDFYVPFDCYCSVILDIKTRVTYGESDLH